MACEVPIITDLQMIPDQILRHICHLNISGKQESNNRSRFHFTRDIYLLESSKVQFTAVSLSTYLDPCLKGSSGLKRSFRELF
ncbi:unnamed protein product [Bemisia tabaci]|uniref:Uncharacterized protein n=1 Tax=Bemisia tabaci TaxID=7038 RepID=A0A9P0F3Y2_BEMTA|nr:unnamed protein product [Bemisia tabaci]